MFSYGYYGFRIEKQERTVNAWIKEHSKEYQSLREQGYGPKEIKGKLRQLYVRKDPKCLNDGEYVCYSGNHAFFSSFYENVKY